MATTWRQWNEDQTVAEVRACDETNANDCVVLGRIQFHALKGYWSIAPKEGSAPSTNYPTQGEAELALLDYQREEWRRMLAQAQQEVALAQRTLALLI